MKAKLTLSALLIAALPMIAQADNASERALQLHQETLSAPSERSVSPQIEADQINGDSRAMQKARADQLNHSRSVETNFAVSDDRLAPAKRATS